MGLSSLMLLKSLQKCMYLVLLVLKPGLILEKDALLQAFLYYHSKRNLKLHFCSFFAGSQVLVVDTHKYH
ncbi:hypothetical protein D3C78_715440 [compost metagenome]